MSKPIDAPAKRRNPLGGGPIFTGSLPSETRLLPCPFCGEQLVSKWFGESTEDGEHGYWSIECRAKECGYKGDLFCGVHGDDMTRHYLDGKPYYCALCGLGFSEFMACEEPDCKLESEEEAKERAKRTRPSDYYDGTP